MKVPFLFIIIPYFLIAQNPKLPNIVSASPEAASLGQYGDVPVDLSTGKINYTIPIYTIKVDGFELPLTLSYNYGGFKPETDPTMVGMGWTANFSGAVIRQLKGIADEDNANGYFKHGDIYENISDLSVENQISYLKRAVDSGYDTRPDKFVINTPTLSGSFRFTPDKTPIFSDHKNYNVLFENSYYFKITDDNGFIFEFDEQEYTTSWNWDTDDETDYRSAWMLSKIVLPDSNKEITFDYDSYYVNHNYSTTTKTIKAEISSVLNGVFEHHLSDDSVLSKIIKRIDFPNGYILFDQQINHTPGVTLSQPFPNWIMDSAPTDQVKLQAISIYNSNNKLIDKFIFDYYDYGYYYFLKSIKKEGINGSQIDYYSFNYANLANIPTYRITNNKVDLWGFYNSKILKESDLTSSLNPNFNYGKIGALTKITYPTKGTTAITYEANEIPRSGSFYDASNPVYNATDFVLLSSEDSQLDCDDRTKLIEIPFYQKVKVTLEVDVTADDSWALSAFKNNSNNNNAYFTLTKGSNGIAEGDSRYFKKEYTVNLSAGTYKLYVDLCEIALHDGVHYAKATINYRTIPYSQDPVNSNIKVGGIRVAETKDCPNAEINNCVIKKYDYHSSGYLTDIHPRFKSISVQVTENTLFNGCDARDLPNGDVLTSCIPGGQYITKYYTRLTQTYRPLTPMTILGSHVSYPDVSIINNDDAIGKTAFKYSVFDTGIPYTQYPTLYEDVDFKRSKVLRKKTQENKLGDFVDVKVENNTYTGTTFNDAAYAFDAEIMRFPKETIFILPDTGQVLKKSAPDQFLIGSVKHKSKAYQLSSNRLIISNDSNDLITQTDYVYDATTGYPVQVKTVNSNAKETVRKTYYSNNKGLLTGLSTTERAAIDALLSQNKKSFPIQTEKLVKGINHDILSKSTQRTNYKTWPSGLTLPEYVQTSKKTGVLEDRIQYHDYYNNGNLKEVSKVNGSSIYYIWGYNKQYPIAKIENFTVAQANIIQTSLIDPAVTASNNDNSAAKENILRTKLNDLRNNSALSKAQVTSYTYDPLIGITSITDPKSNTTYYEYDNFNRLEFVKDAQGKLLSENKYNYKNQ